MGPAMVHSVTAVLANMRRVAGRAMSNTSTAASGLRSTNSNRSGAARSRKYGSGPGRRTLDLAAGEGRGGSQHALALIQMHVVELRKDVVAQGEGALARASGRGDRPVLVSNHGCQSLLGWTVAVLGVGPAGYPDSVIKRRQERKPPMPLGWLQSSTAGVRRTRTTSYCSSCHTFVYQLDVSWMSSSTHAGEGSEYSLVCSTHRKLTMWPTGSDFQ